MKGKELQSSVLNYCLMQATDNLEFLFRKLHFQVEKKKDLTSEEIIKVLRNISGESHREFNAFVCCILSHGSEGSVFGTDGEQVMIKDFLHFFKGHLCKTLAGKPKLFFIQACQGGGMGLGIPKDQKMSAKMPVILRGNCHQVLVPNFKLVWFSVKLENDNVASGGSNIPSEADMLLAMSTVPGYVSYRDPKEGSVFIQSLVKHLQNEYKE
ncbi:caspase-3-like [Saccostrea cucullata]|uniref:caspase-3-like n=1 Tax=Saccostrea cuccullata TaxID=36930 RepID=UPI002ED4FD62